jgi:phosphoserine phosphatase RsbU/P
MSLMSFFLSRFSALTALFPVRTALRSRARMRIRCMAFATLALCCACLGRAQYVDASVAGEPVKLTALWRFHAGDDPAWAAPGFDDSQWTLTPPDKDPQRSNPADFRYGWYRIRVKLPATQQPLAFSLGPAECEIYADGRLAGTIGTPRSTPPKSEYLDSLNVIPLPQELNGRTITLAVRTVNWPVEEGSISWPGNEPSIAPARIQWQRREAESNRSIMGLAPRLFGDVLSLCLGMFSLGLFLLDRRAREYGWAALAYLLGAFLEVASIYFAFHHASHVVTGSVSNIAGTIFFVAMCMFIWGFISTRRGVLFKVAVWSNALSMALFGVAANHLLDPFFGVRGTNILLAGAGGGLMAVFMICIFARIGISAVRGNRNAQLLFLPLTLAWIISFLGQLGYFFFALGWTKTEWSFNALQLGPATVDWYDIFNWLSMASMGFILVLRFTASAKREQRLSSEMETARRVQEQLVPVELPATDHFHFEAAYRPASEVGGDLYQVYPRTDGSVMVLMGDVSGHGLKAAMLGTLLVGAANALAKENLTPVLMLSRLNESLYGQTDGGFVTCLCCLIDPDGRLTLSNAGHLAPYRNGEELPCASGLPLGLVPDADYAETTFQLREGDSLTFLSDGVIEARNPQGELFGFERARDLSTKPASAIADHAVAFGQEDDISVLTLTLTPAEVLHA